jgi:hypothetical protein
MSANLYAWTPDCPLNPKAKDFDLAFEKLLRGNDKPDARLIAFVRALLEVYPDLDDHDTNTVWAAGPLENEVVGRVMNVAVIWPRYEETQRVLFRLARAHALHAYDPQSEAHQPPA